MGGDIVSRCPKCGASGMAHVTHLCHPVVADPGIGQSIPTAPLAPAMLFAACVRYLEAVGWNRDGDDPGTWYRGSFADGGWDFGLALEDQFVRDGVSLMDVPA